MSDLNIDQDFLDEISRTDDPTPIRRTEYLTSKVLTQDIVIPKDRQRDVDSVPTQDSESLILSIKLNGLLQPIVVDSNYNLVAGERRLKAWKSLEKRGHVPTHEGIPVRFISDLTPAERVQVELEENIKRKDLTWKEEALAYVKYHQALVDRFAESPQLQTEYDSNEWFIEWTADEVGYTPAFVHKRLAVGRALLAGDEQVLKADNISAAANLLERRLGREMESELLAFAGVEKPPSVLDITLDLEPGVSGPTPPSVSVDDLIQLQDFLLAPDLDFKPNLIHCDFPYGINLHKSDQMNMAGHETSYDDSPEVYFKLLSYLVDWLPHNAAESCHILFWFPFKYYNETVDAFRSNTRVEPYPLIWHKSDNVGIIPDAQRGPRRVYETALLLSVGDRKIVAAVPNAVSSPRAAKSSGHTSQKPFPVIHHFFRMLCDENSRVFDPTCGSGTALAVAVSLGANRVLGYDVGQDAVDEARNNVRKALLKGQSDDNE